MMCTCHAHKAGPKLIEADGFTYTACGGAFWVENERPPLDPALRSYEVVFRDAQGVERHLSQVRTLRITDLPDNTPACKPAR